MSDTEQKVRGIEFYKVDAQVPPPPDPANPCGHVAMTYKNEDDQRVYEDAAPTLMSNLKITFVAFEEMPLNLIVTEFGPNYPLPQHSHGEDCMYYIERGEILMGSRRLGPGEGFLVRANRPYAYTAGPEGVRVLEIRHEPMNPPNMALHERDIRGWRQRLFDAFGEPATVTA